VINDFNFGITSKSVEAISSAKMKMMLGRALGDAVWSAAAVGAAVEPGEAFVACGGGVFVAFPKLIVTDCGSALHAATVIARVIKNRLRIVSPFVF
jgi:hypothetical protein